MGRPRTRIVEMVPVKVESTAQEVVRHYGHLYDVPQHEMLGRMILFFVEHKADEIAELETQFIERGRQLHTQILSESDS
jgi:hypothetical protein